MRWARRISLIEAHAEGEVGRVITGGVLEIPGATMADKRKALETDDRLRRFCLHEPRGGPAMSVNVVLPPSDPRADLAMLVIESTDYPAMSGSNAMCVVTVALETGMLDMREPETVVVLDTAAGLVEARAACKDGRVESVSLDNVPAFVAAFDVPLEVEGLGTVLTDIAYGGAFFAIVDAGALGLRLERDEARRLVELGERIKAAARAQHPVVHPEDPAICDIGFTLLAGPDEGERDWRNAVVISPGRLDRSPCGTGSCARLAVLAARGQARAGEQHVFRSPLGTRFLASFEEAPPVGGHAAIRPTIAGRAWIVATSDLGLDPDDPFPLGFTLPDLWGPG